MKYILALLLLTSITSCGLGEELCPRVSLSEGCNLLLGEEIQNRVDSIEDIQESMVTEIDTMRMSLYYLSLENINLARYLDDVATFLLREIRANETLVLAKFQLLKQVILQLEHSVAEQIDPCGTEGNQDEVVLRLLNGHYIGVFKQRGKVGLFTLEEGTIYTTTDGTGCQFEIVNGEIEEV